MYFILATLLPLIVAQRPCENLLPGVGRMTRGVDITELDMTPADMLLTNGFRHSLFDMTCDRNRTWSHPTLPDFKVSLPDQIGAINTLPGGALNIKSNFHRTLNDFKKSMAAQAGFELNIASWGSFSLSASYKTTQEQLLRSNKSLVEVSLNISNSLNTLF